MKLAIVLVHYHTPELVVKAVEALRADLERCSVSSECVVVDNGSDAAGDEILRRLPVELVSPGRNLGYAGGVNLGVSQTTGEAILLMNPDVVVLQGCVSALLESLVDGAAVAGPRFYWDEGKRLLLPPGEVRRRLDESATLLAQRGEAWARWARRRWRRHARRHWQAAAPLASYALSGALLAFRRSVWNQVGPFDESFKLYFEETDWLMRVKRQGLSARYLPGAEAVHLYNQSAAREPRSQEWFAESALRFRRQYYGVWFSRLLSRLEGGSSGDDSRLLPMEVSAPGLDLGTFHEPLWIEVSPNRVGFPAAAERLSRRESDRWSLPPEIEARTGPGDLWIQVASERGDELARFLLRPRSYE